MAHSEALTALTLAPDIALHQQKTAWHSGIIGHSRGMQQARDLVRKIADAQVPVLLRGETGTGKDLFARAIHAQSRRRKSPFVTFHCASMNLQAGFDLFAEALPAASPSRLASPLVALHEGGTLYLDEIGDLPLVQQGCLLHFLRELDKRARMAGRAAGAAIRLVAATHADLEQLVKQGSFREDLYFRLSAFPIHLPPLRERGSDIVDLAGYFYREYTTLHGKPSLGISGHALDCLRRYAFPGNVRELENAIERAVLLCESGVVLSAAHLPDSVAGHGQSVLTGQLARERECPVLDVATQFHETGSTSDWQAGSLRDAVCQFEAGLIERALKHHDWNQTHTANALGIPRRTLIDKMQRFDIQAPGRRRRLTDSEAG